MEIIAILGKARTGKDTTADIIHDWFFEEYQLQQYVDKLPIVGMLKAKFPQGEMTKEEYRTVLIKEGKKIREEFGEDIFVKELIECMKGHTQLLLIPDLRLKAEYDYLQQCGHSVRFVKVWMQDKYWRYNFDSFDDYELYKAKHANDPTETDLDDLKQADVHISFENHGDYELLKHKIYGVMDNWLLGGY